MDPIASHAPDFFSASPRERTTAMARSWTNRALTALCVTLALLTLVPLASIIILVLKNGLPLLNWDCLTLLPPAAGMTGGGFGNAILGTATMVLLGLALAAPLGILAAVFINEYSPHSKFSHTVRFVAKLLTGIPSIICGVFAFAAIVLHTGTFSALAGGAALAVLMLPTILLTSEQALRDVPETFREASLGLGATRFQTIARIVLPHAMPAIMTGVMLAVARAAGETAPLVFTALFSQFWASSLSEPTASLSVLIYNFSTVPFPHQIQMAWTASLVLVAFVTAANILAQTAFAPKHK